MTHDYTKSLFYNVLLTLLKTYSLYV